MIKVLQSPAPSNPIGGGLTQTILNNLRFIDRSRFKIDFITFSKERIYNEGELNQLGCKVHYLSYLPSENEKQFIYEFNKILDEGYDALHLNTSWWSGYIMEELATAHNIPVIIVHAHNSMVVIDEDERRNEAIKIHEELKSTFPSDLATHFLACSTEAANWLFGEQIQRDRIIIFNNAIDTAKFAFKPDVRTLRRKELCMEDSFIIGHVGTFNYQKNHDMLIEIFKSVCQFVPNAKLLLIGGGDLRNSIEDKVNEYNLSESVIFLGYRKDVHELMQAMDVLVLPSRFEGLPVALIEAQTTGLKCLASSFVPKDAKLTQNLEFIPDDIALWVGKIIDIAKNPYIRIDMSDAVAERGYSIKDQVKVLEKIYNNEFA